MSFTCLLEFVAWAKENTISKLKWIGVSAIISSIVSFILRPFLDYFSDSVLKFDLSTASPYIDPIVFGFSGSILLMSYYILSINNRNKDENWRFFPSNSTD